MWSDLVPPKQSIGFMPHCRNTDCGQRALDEMSSSIGTPTHATYTHLMYHFFFPIYDVNDKCYGGYTPNLNPDARRKKKISVPVYRCLAGLQTNRSCFFFLLRCYYLSPRSRQCTFLCITSSISNTTRFSAFLPHHEQTCHSNTPITRLAIPSENKTSVPSSYSRAKPYLDVTPSTAHRITAATGRHLSIRSL